MTVFNNSYAPNKAELRERFRRVNQHARQYVLPIVQRLLPTGRIEGHEYVALNPTRADKHLGSFRVNLNTGKWADFATDDRGGDVISLYAYVVGCKQFAALQAIASMLGLNEGGSVR